MTASARQRSRFHKQRVPHLPKPVAHSSSCDHEPATAAVASGPVLLPAPKSNHRMGEEAATPGQPVALARVFWIVPRQFTLENHRLPLALPQSFGKLRKLHVSLNPLSATLSRLATQKTCPLVKKLWTMCLPCGTPRKTKNKHSPPYSVHQRFQSLRSRKGFVPLCLNLRRCAETSSVSAQQKPAMLMWGRPPRPSCKAKPSSPGVEKLRRENSVERLRGRAALQRRVSRL